MLSKKERIVLLQSNIDALPVAVKAGRWEEIQDLGRNIEWHAKKLQGIEDREQPPEDFPYEDPTG